MNATAHLADGLSLIRHKYSCRSSDVSENYRIILIPTGIVMKPMRIIYCSDAFLIFNEGRQRLNSTVGYRVIAANIRELLNNPPGEQSWC